MCTLQGALDILDGPVSNAAWIEDLHEWPQVGIVHLFLTHVIIVHAGGCSHGIMVTLQHALITNLRCDARASDGPCSSTTCSARTPPYGA
jgi:hypothetical protein